MEQKAVDMERKATLELRAEELEERIAPGSLVGPISGNHVHVNNNNLVHLNHTGDVNVSVL